MKITQLAKLISLSCILLVPNSVCAEEESATVLPGLKSVNEATVKDTGTLKVGGKVSHKSFGVGAVKSIHLGDDTTTVNVVFETHGSKWLIAEYANLMVVNE